MKFTVNLVDAGQAVIVESKSGYDVEQWARGKYRNQRYTIKLTDDAAKATEHAPHTPTKRERNVEHAASIMERARKEGYEQGKRAAIGAISVELESRIRSDNKIWTRIDAALVAAVNKLGAL